MTGLRLWQVSQHPCSKLHSFGNSLTFSSILFQLAPNLLTRSCLPVPHQHDDYKKTAVFLVGDPHITLYRASATGAEGAFDSAEAQMKAMVTADLDFR